MPLRGDDRREVRVRLDRGDVHLGEAVAQRGAQLLLAVVAAGVHRGHQLEAGGRLHGELRGVLRRAARLLREDQRALRLQHAVEPLQHAVVRERDLVEEQVVAGAHRGDQRPVAPGEERLGGGRVGGGGRRRRGVAPAALLHAAQRRRHPLEGGAVARLAGAAEHRGAALLGGRLQRRAVAHGALPAEQVRAVRVLVAAEGVERAAEGLGEHVADARLADARLADEQHGLAVVHAHGAEAHEAAQRAGPHEPRTAHGVAQRRGALLAELRHDAGAWLQRVERVGVQLHPHHLLQHALHRRAVRLVPRTLREQHVPVGGELLVADRLARPPAEQVAQRGERLLGVEHALCLAPALQLEEHLHDPLRVRRRDAAAAGQDRGQLVARHVVKVQLDEPVAERAAEHLAPGVRARRVLCGKQHERRVRAHHLARLGDHQLPVVVEQAVERLEHVARRQVQLVQHDPVAAAQRGDQEPLAEDQAAVRVGRVRAEVLLHVGVLVVVDPHKAVPREPRQVRHGARLAGGRGPLDQHGALARDERAGERLELALHAPGEHVGVLGVRRKRPHGQPVGAHLDVLLAGRRRHVLAAHALVLDAGQQPLRRERTHLGGAVLLEQHGKRHRDALGERTPQAVHWRHRVREAQRPGERAHRVVGALVAPVRERVARGELPHRPVPLGDGQHRAAVPDARLADVLGDDRQEGVHVRVGARHVHLGEARAEGRREVPLAHVGRRVHARKDAEARVPRHRLQVAALREHHAAVARLEQGREALERLGRGQVDLVEQQVVAVPERVDERPLDEGEGKLALAGVERGKCVHLRGELVPGGRELLQRRGGRQAAGAAGRQRLRPVLLPAAGRRLRPVRLAVGAALFPHALGAAPGGRLAVVRGGPGARLHAPRAGDPLRGHARRLAPELGETRPAPAHVRLALRVEKGRVAAQGKRLFKERRPGIVERGRLAPRVDRLERAQQVGALGLLAHVEHGDRGAGERREVLHHGRLARARLADEQRRLAVRDARGDLLQGDERRPGVCVLLELRRAGARREAVERLAADLEGAARHVQRRHAPGERPVGALLRDAQLLREERHERVVPVACLAVPVAARLGQRREEQVAGVEEHVLLERRVREQGAERMLRHERVNPRAPLDQLAQRDAPRRGAARRGRQRVGDALPGPHHARHLVLGQLRERREARAEDRAQVRMGWRRRAHDAPVLPAHERRRLRGARRGRQEGEPGRGGHPAVRAQVQLGARADRLGRRERRGERRNDRQHVGRRLVDVLQHHPDALPHRAGQRALDPLKRAGARGARDEGA